MQASFNVAESGVTTAATWRALVGPDMQVEDAMQLETTSVEYNDDMADEHDGLVWLVGEQRWSKPYSAQQ